MTARKKQFKTILDRFAAPKVLVLGDVMLDHYIWGSVKRISPEASVPVVDVNSESVRLGGAGDTVLSTLSLALAVGASLPIAARLANLAAGIVVGIVGTASLEKKMLENALPVEQ